MEHDIGAFLRSRRARLQPEALGLPAGGRRRVPGLRREELAQLAGVSVDYYVRLEQGRTTGVSDSVLDAVARALELSAVEHEHLLTLARPRPLGPAAAGSDTGPQQITDGLRTLLDTIDTIPAYVIGRRTDVLAWNTVADAVFGYATRRPCERNHAWFTFMHPDAPTLYPDWRRVAAQTVGYLALDAGRHPGDPQLERLVGELAISSETFRELWARHDILQVGDGAKRIHHPVAGDVSFEFQTLLLPHEPDQLVITLTVEPGSPSEQRLRMLSSWNATVAPEATRAR